MQNKYTTGCAHALQRGNNKTRPAPLTDACPACGARCDAIISNGLPPHHIDFSCQCNQCNFQWQPNQQDSM